MKKIILAPLRFIKVVFKTTRTALTMAQWFSASVRSLIKRDDRIYFKNY